MNFHETKRGAIFFDGQLPKLISALEGIASALKQPTPVYQLNAEVPENFLTDLYHGYYEPTAVRKSEVREDWTHEILACQRKLRDEVSPEAWDLIERLSSLLNGRNVYDCEQAFAAGFQSAITMLAAGCGHHMREETKE